MKEVTVESYWGAPVTAQEVNTGNGLEYRLTIDSVAGDRVPKRVVLLTPQAAKLIGAVLMGKGVA